MNSRDILESALLQQEAEDAQIRWNRTMEPNGLEDTSAMFIPGGRAATSFAPKGLGKTDWLKKADPLLKNADGSPKVYYHGTTADINAFKDMSGVKSSGRYKNEGNTFLTDDVTLANEYAHKGAYGHGTAQNSLGGNVIPVNVNSEKLFDMSNMSKPGRPRQLDKAYTDKLKAQGYTGTANYRSPGEISVFDNASIKSAFHKNGGYDDTAELLSDRRDMADFYDNWWK